MEKLNDPERIKWTARFQKILIELNITFPVKTIREFRFVLINMFGPVQQELNEIQSLLHLTMSGNSKTLTSEPTKREQKAPKGHQPTGAPAKLCTVCGRYFHESTACCLKESQYANHASEPYIGSEALTRLVKDKGVKATFIPLEGSGKIIPILGGRQNQPPLRDQVSHKLKRTGRTTKVNKFTHCLPLPYLHLPHQTSFPQHLNLCLGRRNSLA